MESLNMHTLARTLPSSATVTAEQDLSDKFKAAALTLTTLYKSSQQSAKCHYDAGYNAGYLAALDDLMSVIQHGVSTSSSSLPTIANEYEMSIGRVMDWIDARSVHIRSKANDSEDGLVDDCDEKASVSPSNSVEAIKLEPSVGKPRIQRPSGSRLLPTPNLVSPTLTNLSSESSQIHPLGDNSGPSLVSTDFSLQTSPVASVHGLKRRHGSMIQDSCTPSNAHIGNVSEDIMSKYSLQTSSDARGAMSGFGVSRRRSRNLRMSLRDGMLSSSRADGQLPQGNANNPVDLDEENGRERKRMTRR